MSRGTTARRACVAAWLAVTPVAMPGCQITSERAVLARVGPCAHDWQWIRFSTPDEVRARPGPPGGPARSPPWSST